MNVMKKTYTEPSVKVVTLHIESLMTTLSRGDNMSSGEGDARQGAIFDEDEE